MVQLSFESLPKIVMELKAQVDILTMSIESAKSAKKENDLLSTEEAAKFLNLSKSTLYNKVNKRELPVMKQGKRLYFSRVELTNYIKSGKVLSNREIEEQTNNFLSNPKRSA